ncbi:AIR synthase related protein [Klebsiella pneumoniae subsp. pneumoniae]|nr:AIR synthase related protein [Klebsiella pneumoniae subsp. pneumoniae]
MIDPLFFPGGNIGKLAVCGTANDVAVSGAIRAIFPAALFSKRGWRWPPWKRWSPAWPTPPRAAGIAIVTGDTKVVPRARAADKLFINTAGIGAIPADVRWGTQQISAGDVLLVSGTLGITMAPPSLTCASRWGWTARCPATARC